MSNQGEPALAPERARVEWDPMFWSRVWTWVFALGAILVVGAIGVAMRRGGLARGPTEALGPIGTVCSGAITVLGWLGLSSQINDWARRLVTSIFSHFAGCLSVAAVLYVTAGVLVFRSFGNREMRLDCAGLSPTVWVDDTRAQCGEKYWLASGDTVRAESPGFARLDSTVGALSKPGADTLTLKLKPRKWDCAIEECKIDDAVFDGCGQPGNWVSSRSCRVTLTSSLGDPAGFLELQISSQDQQKFAVAIEPASDGCYGRADAAKRSEKDSMALEEECKEADGTGASWRATLITCETVRKPTAKLSKAAKIWIQETASGKKELNHVECEL